MLSFDEMATYCIYENNIGPGLAMADAYAPCGLSATVPPGKVDIVSDEVPAPISTTSEEAGNETDRRTSFTDLPFEIRLHIYHWLHLMSPVRHAQLAPWYPTPVHCQYILRRVEPDQDSAADADADKPDDDDDAKQNSKCTPSPGLLSPFRPLSGFPTSFLQCNSQIYHETRSIPFAHNEFVFVNWFASGLWAARAFTRALKPWQSADLRFVRLEILARDLAGGSAGEAEWHALCDDWALGVRGLRMKMVLGGTGTGVMAWGAAAAAAHALDRQGDADTTEVARDAGGRVLEGLRRMRRLETVEMELVTRHLKDHQKIAWCEKLEAELRSTGLEGVKVVCTEKVQEKMEWMKRETEMKHLQSLTAY